MNLKKKKNTRENFFLFFSEELVLASMVLADTQGVYVVWMPCYYLWTFSASVNVLMMHYCIYPSEKQYAYKFDLKAS